FEESFLVIHIVTNSIDDAYKLFTVLNDRGINLTEGELLKAHTIGICSDNLSHQRTISDNWDAILKHPSKKVTDYLRWILIMLTGNNITASSVLEEYKKTVFNELISKSEIAQTVAYIRDCVERLEYISSGEWPFENNNDNKWHKSKLDLLINKLKHLHAMPLLLAASFSSENNFKHIVNETSKFFIRCKMISDLHASIFSKLYAVLALRIHKERDRFDISKLHGAFNEILLDKDPEDVRFSTNVRSLIYQKKGDNKPIKCLLMTIQENWEWLKQPCQGNSLNRLKREDQTIIFDFNSMTLEHIYPYSALHEDKDMDMEKLKNNIGNIVLLDPTRNNKNDNKPFIDKKNSFENTGIGIHSWIYEQKEWTEESVKKLTETYVDAAVKVFSFS
ncbi:HNH endonuclease, partial [Salmonella enterica subsp. enterica serovar Saintpaul]|nr:HNH endonuclease [Salmonella enterica subsp. enterica serovar Saintpaul]ELH3518082.1 HNH endonuclease [Salmonella enterica]